MNPANWWIWMILAAIFVVGEKLPPTADASS